MYPAAAAVCSGLFHILRGPAESTPISLKCEPGGSLCWKVLDWEFLLASCNGETSVSPLSPETAGAGPLALSSPAPFHLSAPARPSTGRGGIRGLLMSPVWAFRVNLRASPPSASALPCTYSVVWVKLSKYTTFCILLVRSSFFFFFSAQSNKSGLNGEPLCNLKNS